MEAFAATLLGAFIGVFTPYLIETMIERRNFRRTLDAVFLQCEKYAEGTRAKKAHLLDSAKGNVTTFRDRVSKLVKSNLTWPIFPEQELLQKYAKFLRSEHVLLLVQNRENLLVLRQTLENVNFSNMNGLENAVNSLIEQEARRCWILYSIAAGRNIPFDSEKYDALFRNLDQLSDRRVTNRRLRRLRFPNHTSDVEKHGTQSEM